MHIFVLLHGLHGKASDLAVVREAVQSNIANALCYAIASNEANTSDGIDAGGRRAALELDEFLRKHEQPRQLCVAASDTTPMVSSTCSADSSSSSSSCTTPHHTTKGPTRTITEISIIAYSLGGLYARYMIQALNRVESSPYKALRKRFFVTLATPHLGAVVHTLVSTFAGLVKAVLTTTQRQLLLLDDDVTTIDPSLSVPNEQERQQIMSERRPRRPLLLHMATQTRFTDAWAQFEATHVYSNVWHDFLVTYCTGAIEMVHLKDRWMLRSSAQQQGCDDDCSEWQTDADFPEIYDRARNDALFFREAQASASQALPSGVTTSVQYATKSELNHVQMHMCVSLSGRVNIVRFAIKDRFICAHADACALLPTFANEQGRNIIRHVIEQVKRDDVKQEQR